MENKIQLTGKLLLGRNESLKIGTSVVKTDYEYGLPIR